MILYITICYNGPEGNFLTVCKIWIFNIVSYNQISVFVVCLLIWHSFIWYYFS